MPYPNEFSASEAESEAFRIGTHNLLSLVRRPFSAMPAFGRYAKRGGMTEAEIKEEKAAAAAAAAAATAAAAASAAIASKKAWLICGWDDEVPGLECNRETAADPDAPDPVDDGGKQFVEYTRKVQRGEIDEPDEASKPEAPATNNADGEEKEDDEFPPIMFFTERQGQSPWDMFVKPRIQKSRALAKAAAKAQRALERQHHKTGDSVPNPDDPTSDADASADTDDTEDMPSGASSPSLGPAPSPGALLDQHIQIRDSPEGSPRHPS